MSITRRTFLTAAAGLGSAAPWTRPRSGRAPAPSRPALLDLLIAGERATLLEALVARIRAGLRYPELLGALAEAAARQVQPYPHVGFKYHAFMVLHAVDRTTRLGSRDEPWLPILWAADAFKGAQAQEHSRGGWVLPAAPAPPAAGATSRSAARKPEQALHQALAQWDAEAADAALVALLRQWRPERVLGLLWPYGARDFRAIGHKAITVANCSRLLPTVPPEHAQPMLRSLVLALQNHHGEPSPATTELAADEPWRRNRVRVEEIEPSPAFGEDSEDSEAALAAVLAVLRDGSADEAGAAAAAWLTRGVAERTLWSAVFAAAGELMLRDPGIIAVHANTTSDALFLAARQVGKARTRRLLLLQAASFQPLFRDLIGQTKEPPRLDRLEPVEPTSGVAAGSDLALEDVFATLSASRAEAAGKALGYLGADGSELAFMRRARHYTVERNQGAHDYKFTEAAFRNAEAMPAEWRRRYLAASVLYMNGPGDAVDAAIADARVLLADAGIDD